METPDGDASSWKASGLSFSSSVTSTMAGWPAYSARRCTEKPVLSRISLANNSPISATLLSRSATTKTGSFSSNTPFSERVINGLGTSWETAGTCAIVSRGPRRAQSVKTNTPPLIVPGNRNKSLRRARCGGCSATTPCCSCESHVGSSHCGGGTCFRVPQH